MRAPVLLPAARGGPCCACPRPPHSLSPRCRAQRPPTSCILSYTPACIASSSLVLAWRGGGGMGVETGGWVGQEGGDGEAAALPRCRRRLAARPGRALTASMPSPRKPGPPSSSLLGVAVWPAARFWVCTVGTGVSRAVRDESSAPCGVDLGGEEAAAHVLDVDGPCAARAAHASAVRARPHARASRRAGRQAGGEGRTGSRTARVHPDASTAGPAHQPPRTLASVANSRHSFSMVFTLAVSSVASLSIRQQLRGGEVGGRGRGGGRGATGRGMAQEPGGTAEEAGRRARCRGLARLQQADGRSFGAPVPA